MKRYQDLPLLPHPPRTYLQRLLDRCQFRCRICDSKSTSWLELKRHWARDHPKTSSTILKRPWTSQPARHVIKRRIHKCKVCGKTLLCDHELLLEHYRRRHHCSKKSFLKFWNDMENVKSKIEFARNFRVGKTKPRRKKFSSFSDWQAGCTYQCPDCVYTEGTPKYFLGFIAFKRHLTKDHRYERFE